jgi:ABC transporter substrate binding protein
MRRREFIAALMLASTMRVAVAQHPAKMKRIAMVHPSRKVDELTINGPPFYKAFFEELSRLGYVERQNLAVERYSGEGRIERYSELAREVVGSHPDLIFAMSGAIALPLKLAATTIPIVTITADPVALGLVQALRIRAATSLALQVMRVWNSMGNALGFSPKRCQNCLMPVTLHRERTGKDRRPRRCVKQSNGPEFR